jgi:hypothetical protein
MPFMKICSIALALSLLPAGCAASRPAGRASLDALRGGMTMEQVIRELGEPTARIELRAPGEGGVYYDLSYVDTIIDPGVVEFYFRPTLSEIFIDAELYREY